MFPIFIGLGSNVGKRQKNIEVAIISLSGFISSIKRSSLWETEPVGVANQPWFLNGVIGGETQLSSEDLLSRCKEIEKNAGRDIDAAHSSMQPRPLDIDILFFGNEIIHTPVLTIPHPRLHLRKFVLVPLAQIAPDFVHPVLKKTEKELLNECPDTSIVRPL